MSNIRRWRDLNDDFAWVEDFFSPRVFSHFFKGRLVDESAYDIVPKRETIERLVKEKEKGIEYLEKQLKQLSKEKDELLQKLK